MAQYRLLGISGSLRKEATNRKLVAEATRLFDPAVLPGPEVMVPDFGSAFDADGLLIDEQTSKGLTALMNALGGEFGR